MFENVDMSVVAAGIVTFCIVLSVAIICYFIDRKLKKYIGDKQNETNPDSGVFSALVLTNNAINAFEKTLKETFNEAIDDGVITKDELFNIVTKTIASVKDQVISDLTDDINESSESDEDK